MKLFITPLALVLTTSSFAFAGDPVNETCPISGNAINPNSTQEVGEDVVGFCCNGCLSGFTKWSQERKATYIASQKNLKSEPVVTKTEELFVKTPYLLDIGADSGKKLDPDSTVVQLIDGRELRFCTDEGYKSFVKNKKSMFAKIDKLMIADQLPYYPIATCVVSGEDLDVHGSPVDFIYGNRLFRTCCNDCKAEFVDNPAEYVSELDAEIINAQEDTYPLTNCVIGKKPHDAMGGSYNLIVGNRLVILCCAGCKMKVLQEPLVVFAEINAARK